MSPFERNYPAHPSPRKINNRSIIIFLTICTQDQKKILATSSAHELIVNAWNKANRWMVGDYVIMPDHIHLLCSPRTFDSAPLKQWIHYWKGLVRIEWPHESEKPLWQKGYWDTQLRRSQNYQDKRVYMRENPVRKKLVAKAEDWPYQGQIHRLTWRD